MSFSAKKVVVPVDFSGESKLALEAATAFGGDIHLIHVLFPLSKLGPGVSLADATEDDRAATAKAKLVELCGDTPVTATEVLVGTPGLEIAEYAQKIAADLIVIPSHGYHGVKRLVLGSVAERVIRHAECSVLVLRRSDAQ